MSDDDYVIANRAAWEAASSVHQELTLTRLTSKLKDSATLCLDDTAIALLAKAEALRANVAQFGCNNGRETISIRRLGARSCTGFDSSRGFLEQASVLQAASGTPCHFVLADICQIPQQFYESYDVVYISVGVLGWIADLDRLFWNVRRVLHSGGRLAIYEMHPALDMFLENETRDPPPLTNSYFKTQPRVGRVGLDYISGRSYDSPPYYWFHHKMSDIFNSIISNGLNIASFNELDHDISSVYAPFNNILRKPPLSYTLLAKLPARSTSIDTLA